MERNRRKNGNEIFFEQGKIIMDRILDLTAHGFIIYLIIGEILFMTAGIIIPTFIF